MAKTQYKLTSTQLDLFLDRHDVRAYDAATWVAAMKRTPVKRRTLRTDSITVRGAYVPSADLYIIEF